MIEFDKEICQDFKESSNREWLEANGLGGFASGTISGANSRRYHGLLVAAIKPPVLRMVLVNQYEETIKDADSAWNLSTHIFWNPQDEAQGKGAVILDGYRWIEKFKLYPFPTWIFESEAWKIEKTVFMVYGQNTTVTLYRLLQSTAGTLQLKIRPLLTGRDFHHFHLENKKLNAIPKTQNGKISFYPYTGVPCFSLHHNGNFEPSFHWYKHFYYPIEAERGEDSREDCWSPGEILYELTPDLPAYLIASAEPKVYCEVDSLLSAEKKRRESSTKIKGKKSGTEGIYPVREKSLQAAEAVRHNSWRTAFSNALYSLMRSADQLIVARDKKLKSVIAGYPWFADWGRDTFISIFGLCYATGKDAIAKGILTAFAKYVNQGMIPNYFPDSGEKPLYNSVDASLWYLYAVRQYWKESDDLRFIRETVWEKCLEIIHFYRSGTRYKIHLDNDGLISAGTPGIQLTWMDAKVGDWVVTPRIGKPVEIQALWYNALNCMAELAHALRDPKQAEEFRGLARWCKNSFNRIFWYERGGYCYDLVQGAQKDSALRPNQIFAISLPFELLEKSRAKSVLEVIDKYLLTPYGLRSLSPLHPQYQGRYVGNLKKRDGAYHQGTVWSWLMGPYITATLKTFRYSAHAKEQCRKQIEPLLAHLSETGLGSISEIFDGDPPHYPRGCISQAWSAAEMLRLLLCEL